MKGLLKLKNSDKGQSMVEFAIVLPLLIALVVGIIQFGFIFNVKITLTNQARDTVRLIAVGSLDENDADESVRSSLKDNSIISKYTEGTKLSVVAKKESLANGEIQASVTITIPEFDLMIVSKTTEISGSATMRIEPGDGFGGGTPGGSGNYDQKLETFKVIYEKAAESYWKKHSETYNLKQFWDNGGNNIFTGVNILEDLIEEKGKITVINELKAYYPATSNIKGYSFTKVLDEIIQYAGEHARSIFR